MLGHVVLLIADEHQLRRSLRYTLNHHGAQLLGCRRAREGAELVELHHPDLVLLDLRQSDLSCLDATQLLRDCTDAPIITLSDIDDEEQKNAAFRTAAD